MCGPIDLLVEPGQSWGIVGFNAAGKSTLLRTLVGYQEPVSGESVILGSFTDDSSFIYRKAVSVVLDEDAFFPSLSVEEHLQLIAGGHAVADPQAAWRGNWSSSTLRRQDRTSATTLLGPAPAIASGRRFVAPLQTLVLDEPEQRLDPTMRAALAARLRRRVERDRAAGGHPRRGIPLDGGRPVLVISDGRIVPSTVAEGVAAIAHA